MGRAKRTPVVRGNLLLSAGKGEMADGKAGGGSAVVAEVREQLMLPEASVGENVRPTGMTLSDSAISTNVGKEMNGACVSRRGKAGAKSGSVGIRVEDAEVVEVQDSEGKVTG